MTITVLPTRNEYTATAGQTIFFYTFKIFSGTDLNVYVTPSGQQPNDITDITTPVSVGGVGEPGGGIVTINPVNAGDLVTIVSNIPASRTVDYQNNGDFRPETVNNDFDRVVSIAKQVEDIANRTLSFEESQQSVNRLTLPEPEAGRLVQWKADESGLENVDIATPVEISITSIAALRNLSEASGYADNTEISVLGYYTPGDGGGGQFYWDAASVLADDNENIIKVTSIATGRFIRLYEGNVEYDSIASMRSGAGGLYTGQLKTVHSYYSGGSCGGGKFYWLSTSTSADDGGRIIKAVPTTGRWIRITDSDIYIADNYGVKKDGSDTSTEMQNLADVISVSGGTIKLDPQGVYGFGTQIDFKSQSPINIISDMGEPSISHSTGQVDGGYIKPLSGIVGSIFNFEGPTFRYWNPGGVLRGLTFLDDSDLTNATVELRRTVAIDAAVSLMDWDFGSMENCHFRYIKGSAIFAERSIKSNITGGSVEQCGDTGKPAIDLASLSTNTLVQSFTLSNVKIEYNFNDVYLDIAVEGGTISVINCNFETGSSDPDSEYTYINSDAPKTKIIGCNFNKNDAINIIVTGDESILADSTFDGDNVSGRIQWSGPTGSINNVIMSAALSNVTTQVNITGAEMTVNSLTLKRGGNLICSGLDSNISNVKIMNPDTTESFAMVVSGADTVVTSPKVDETAGTTSGISLTATGISVIGGNLNNVLGDGIVLSGSATRCAVNGTVMRVIGGDGVDVSTNNNSISNIVFQAITGTDITDTGAGNVKTGNVGS